VWEALGPEHIRDGVLPAGVNRSLLWRMLEGRVNAPATTSVGRLFDAAAALTGIALRNRFEGQAAMLLEWEIGPVNTQDAYSIPCGDWAPLIEELVTDIGRGVARSRMAARFHNALVNWVLNIAEQTGVPRVAMSGGVFQNRYLTQRATDLLESRGFSVYSHRQVPPNDGGIALGQAVLAGRC
jgi:hydrogenase maturation protein HypF